MILSREAITKVEDYIEETELCEEVERDNSFEMKTDGVTLVVTFTVFARFVEEYNYHDEFAYDNIEDLSYYEFDGAEITRLEAYDEDGDDVEISNKKDIKYW